MFLQNVKNIISFEVKVTKVKFIPEGGFRVCHYAEKYLTNYAVCKKYLCEKCSYAKSRLAILVCSKCKNFVQVCSYAETK